MKKAFFFAAIALFSFGFQSALHAQKTATWKGGAPGHETDWHFYKNWSLGQAPGEFDRVVVQDVSTSTRHYSVVRSGEVEVLSLEIQSGASLTLLSGARLIANEFNCAGQCKGCEMRILVEGTAKSYNVTASAKQ